jgi:pimeloyl-ACP methyl ester carboxylesterase
VRVHVVAWMATASPARKTIDIGGDEISYLESGSGSPLLLIHGLGHSSSAWLRSFPRLEGRYRVIAPDLPGHGRSTAPPASYDPPHFARFITAFVSALGLGAADAAGNSLGGLALLLAALDHPHTFRRLILADPLGFTKPPVPPLGEALLSIIGLWLSFPRTRAVVRAGYAMSFFDAKLLDDESVNEIVARLGDQPRHKATRRTVTEIFHYSKRLTALHERLAHLAPPTLVVWGKNDPVLPSKDAEIARRVLPAPRIEVLERCGHFPHIEQSEAFCALALEFLSTA